jgi:hypothetical protein
VAKLSLPLQKFIYVLLIAGKQKDDIGSSLQWHKFLHYYGNQLTQKLKMGIYKLDSFSFGKKVD